MNNIEDHNEFKFLAIRPLKGTSAELLKGLQENCIYSFYSEYKYINKDGKEILDSKDYSEIESIEHTPIVPTHLYGENINISAIVGQNGSGKSTLMELFYYAILLYNKKHIDNEKLLEIDFNAEMIILKKDAIQVLTISTKSKKSKKSKIYRKKENIDEIVYKEDNSIIATSLNKSVDFKFYSNVLNYSIYGLNSSFIPWIDLIFYKNDAYQLPIVINPFKSYGNYDINKEYLLMQSRAVFYTYVLDFKEIIEDIFIHNIHFEISINKILKIDNSRQTFDILQQFLELNASKTVYDNLLFKDINSDNLIALNSMREFLQDGSSEWKGEYSIVLYNKDLLNINLYKTFTYLYIFKKIYKISKTYKKYKKYHFLFSDKLPFDFQFNDLRSNVQLNVINTLSDIKNKEIVYEVIMVNLDLVLKKNGDLTEDDLFFIKELFMEYYQVRHDVTNNITRHLSKVHYDADIQNTINTITELIKKLFNGKQFRQYLFNHYINELKRDESHITFKLKQAINYFKFDLFSSIELNNSSIDVGSIIKLDINKKYFKGRKQIEDIPLAVFNHVIEVVKTKEKDEDKRSKLVANEELKPYPYTSLSSGEQHLINSILTIAYHNYNLLSVENDSDLIKYNNINLVFDELELYLHPEYQRVYINNLINVLNKIQEITNQNNIYYNILMVTHSPFILSDIPSQNILKLKDGKPVPNDSVNSFAANIYDLLKDEFFLENGAIGAYVSKKIKSILKKKVVEQEDLEVINLIGDPFLKGVINKQIENKVSTEILNKEIMRLQEILTNRS
ncbi:AAA family ATPase [Flavobacterium chungangense]|uniref:AAA family ATPase n=2 Tax=Flavobacterium chungangense TaxID=554283 RepID=UPI0004DEEAD5|nr:ATP-binding protein [Flavobacterium chungangense]